MAGKKSTPEIMSVEQLRIYLRIDWKAAKELLESGTIPGRQIRGRWRVHKQAVDDWLCKNNSQLEEPEVKTCNYSPETLIKMVEFIKDSTENTKKALELLNEILLEVNKMR